MGGRGSSSDFHRIPRVEGLVADGDATKMRPLRRRQRSLRRVDGPKYPNRSPPSSRATPRRRRDVRSKTANVSKPPLGRARSTAVVVKGQQPTAAAPRSRVFVRFIFSRAARVAVGSAWPRLRDLRVSPSDSDARPTSLLRQGVPKRYDPPTRPGLPERDETLPRARPPAVIARRYHARSALSLWTIAPDVRRT